MTDLGALTKVRFERAEQLAEVLAPSDEARLCLKPEASGAAFIRALADAGLNIDSLRYLAVALPRREAVWWACMTHRRLAGPDMATDAAQAERDAACWKAAEAWVYEPTEQNRQACYDLAQALDFNTAGAYAALGAFWADGNLAPPGSGVVVPPGDGLTGSAVAASVILSCVPGVAKSIAERHRVALLVGADIANGGYGEVPVEPVPA